MRNVYIINPKAGQARPYRAVYGAHPRRCMPRTGKSRKFTSHSVRAMARSWQERPPKRAMRCAFGPSVATAPVLEVVRGAEFHKNAAVGVYPCGSGNDFVRSFGKREVF